MFASMPLSVKKVTKSVWPESRVQKTGVFFLKKKAQPSGFFLGFIGFFGQAGKNR